MGQETVVDMSRDHRRFPRVDKEWKRVSRNLWRELEPKDGLNKRARGGGDPRDRRHESRMGRVHR